MKSGIHTTFLMFLTLALASPLHAQNDYYYVPRKAAPGEKTSPSGGVLVREIQIRRGDTLSGISRKFSGRGSYYPQILLFNGIKNPHLIHDGERVRVPVSRNVTVPLRSPAHASQSQAAPPVADSVAQPVDEIPLSELKRAPERKSNARHRGRRQQTGHVRSSAMERKQFGRALKAYQRGEWRAALDRFDAFLSSHPDSPLAADASLYKADCFLKLGTP